MAKTFSKKQLLELGYQLCEYDGECEECQREIPEGKLWWLDGPAEYPRDGSSFCAKCITKRHEEDVEYSKLLDSIIDEYILQEIKHEN